MTASAATNAALILGETKGFWINTGALVLSILVAAAAIFLAATRERKRSTLEFLNSRHKDDELMEAIRFVRYDLESKGDLGFIDDPNCPNAKRVRMALNYHEFVAQSIMQRALDEGMYKQMQYSNLMKFWGAAEPAVRFIQSKHGPTLFQDMEWLVARWRRNPIVCNRDRVCEWI